MLEFIYYPVSFILWCWHKVFGFVLGDHSAIAWVLAIMFLTFTVRGIMFKPFVNQVRSMKKMQDFAPEMKKVQKKYANDKQRQAQEMQKLQREHGVNPLGSCLPMLLQIPVFIGLNWVLRAFQYQPSGGGPKTENYFFGRAGVESYTNAEIFGVNIGDAIYHISTLGGAVPAGAGGWHWEVAVVSVPLTIVASIATHFTARHSVSRQNPDQATGQTAFMNRITLWIFPLGLLVFGAFFPVGLLIYFLANNGWTLMQQRVIYRKIDREDEAKKEEAVEKRTALAPKPGQKPASGQKPAPGQKPAQQKAPQETQQKSGQARDSGAGKAASSGAKSGGSGGGGQSKSGSGSKGKSSAGAKTTNKSPSNGSGGSWAKGGGAQRTSAGPANTPGQQAKSNGSSKGNGSPKQKSGSNKKSGRKRR